MENFFYDFERMNAQLQYLITNNLGAAIIIAVIIFLFFFLVRKMAASIVVFLIQKISKQRDDERKAVLEKVFKKPIQDLSAIFGIFCAVNVLPLSPIITAWSIFALRIVIIVILSWIAYNCCGPQSLVFSPMQKKMSPELSKTVIPFISNILKLIVAMLSIVIIISEFGYNISGFIAGLGLGGLAFALAAQDTAANIFGGAVIVLDKPLIIGDWIQVGETEGIVEEINLRSTRIRTFTDALVVVPNSKIASQAIINWSKMEKRLISFRISLTYATSKEQLQTCVDKISLMLSNHPDVISDTVLVTFESFEKLGFDLNVILYTSITEFVGFKKLKEEINFGVMGIIEESGADFAYFRQPISLEGKVGKSL